MNDTAAETMTPPPAWAQSVARPGQELGKAALRVISGAVPEGLRGTLYRNGPARLERGGMPVGHWFDGDGAVLAVDFADDAVTAVYRYVQTKGLREEAEASRLLYGNYGMTAPGPIWNQWQRPIKNVANTAVLALPDRVLALWEAGSPYALHSETLETFGEDDLAGPGGRLRPGEPYSAHPKQDPETGDIYNFGVAIRGRDASLLLYRSDASGALTAKAQFELEGVPLIHDFVLAGPYLVFIVPPVRVEIVSVLLGRKCYSDAMRWRPELGTGILVFDRETLKLVARGAEEPWFQWHFGNGAFHEDPRTGQRWLTLDFVRYEDFSTNQHLREVARGHTTTPTRGTLWRLRINQISARTYALEQISDRSIEFPHVPAAETGRHWRKTFFVAHRTTTDTTAERYDTLGSFDYETRAFVEATLGESRYPSEPIVAADADGRRQWLLSVVYNGEVDASEVWVFDADALDQAPACVLALPGPVPLSFHGGWRPGNPSTA